jgi:hypothetical protein
MTAHKYKVGQSVEFRRGRRPAISNRHSITKSCGSYRSKARILFIGLSPWGSHSNASAASASFQGLANIRAQPFRARPEFS